jgi:tryptophan-rich sensory protein
METSADVNIPTNIINCNNRDDGKISGISNDNNILDLSLSDCTTIIEGKNTITQVPSVTTIVTETTCKGPRHGKVERYDFTKKGIPPNNKSDILILTSGVIQESGEMLLQRTAMLDMWFIYISITIIYILFFISAIFGINSTWYTNLKKSGISPWLIGSLWVIVTILSYIAIFMIWRHVKPGEIVLDLTVSIYFLIGSFLALLWAAVFFQGNNIGLSVWIAALNFLYQFWLLIYVWYIKPAAAIFMIPALIMYGYIFYAMVHLATINNIEL